MVIAQQGIVLAQALPQIYKNIWIIGVPSEIETTLCEKNSLNPEPMTDQIIARKYARNVSTGMVGSSSGSTTALTSW